MMVEIGGILAGISVYMLLYGIKKLTTPVFNLERFIAHKYNVDEDELFLERERELKELQKLYKVDSSKKILLLIVGMATCGLVGYSISGRLHISLLSSFFGLIVPMAFENWHAEGRRKQLEKQFEQAAEQMAIVIKSGGSVQQALERAAQDAKQPLKRELELMAAQAKVISITEVFQNAKERIPVPEIEMMVMVASLQRQGLAVNIASVLERIQDSIRARRGFQEQISAITAEGRFASKVVGAMPFVVIAFIRKAAPQFVDPLFTTAWGMGLLGASILAIFGGMAWINKMVNVGH